MSRKEQNSSQDFWEQEIVLNFSENSEKQAKKLKKLIENTATKVVKDLFLKGTIQIYSNGEVVIGGI